MTPNHTPTDDRRREQATPSRTTGQQPMGQPQQQSHTRQGQPQPPKPSQQIPQGQSTPQTIQQGQGIQQAPPPQPQLQQPQTAGQQQPPQAMGQQLPAAQPAPGTASGQAQYGQPSTVQPQRQRRGTQQPLLKPLRVNEIITEDVVTAERDTPVRTVVAQMSEHNIGSTVVVEDDRPIGIITDRKVALALEEMPDIAQRTAEELLQGDVFTADPSMDIFDAIQIMREEGIRRLPIVDDNGALRGIVTLDDALVLLGGVVSDIADTVQSQSPRL